MSSLRGKVTLAIKKINDIRIEEHGKFLLHYTSQEALRSIIESEEMHLSSLAFMNDPMEIRYGIKFVRMVLQDIRSCVANSEDGMNSLERLLDAMILQTKQMASKYSLVFVLSLTAKGEKLIHWRTYGEDAKGVALRFDKETLLNLPASDNDVRFMLIPVSYFSQDRDDIASALREFFDEIASDDVFVNSIANASESELSALADQYLNELALLPLVLKSEDYSDEHEWRLITTVLSGRTSQVHYPGEQREKGPKLHIPLCTLNATSDPPIKDLIIGPAVNSMQFRVLLQESLMLTGRRNPNYIDSEIEYRPRDV